MVKVKEVVVACSTIAVWYKILGTNALISSNGRIGPRYVVRMRQPHVHEASKSRGFSSSDVESASSSSSDDGRKQSIATLEEWSTSVGIQRQRVKVASGKSILGGGLGLLSTSSIAPNSVLLQVPSHLAFTVTNSPLDTDPAIDSFFSADPKAYRSAPWWAKLSLDLYYADRISSLRSTSNAQSQIDMRPWLDSLPRTFTSPLHWTEEQRAQLQYPPLQVMVHAQEQSYRSAFDTLSKAARKSASSSSSSPLLDSNWTYQDFLWGCECAKSRAFSGSYGGSAFNPAPYALTLVLVAIYVAFDFGTLEQAANGAALVFCGTILRDFVFPKLFQSKRYVICPYIDMANHVGIRPEGNVAFEYFADSYSLVSRPDGGGGASSIGNQQELRISYGSKSNDALLQNYGFVEIDNAHDVYVMPPLGEWDITALENACGRQFRPGRLEKLKKAGLLGSNLVSSKTTIEDDDAFDDESAANRRGGVVITRSGGIDPAILTAVRVLVSNDQEWAESGEAVGNFVTENSGGVENEKVVRVVLMKALELELDSKETTLEEDESLLESGRLNGINEIIVRFRIEKKKLLKETIQNLSYA